jgi:hypothetical protein
VAVVDDVVYAIGRAVPNTAMTFLSTNEQYIPIGYNASLPPVASPSSNPLTEFPLIYITAVVLTITVAAIIASIFFRSKKRTNKPSKRSKNDLT